MRAIQKIALILIIVYIGALLIIGLRTKKQALTYQGRSIDYWFAQLPVTMVTSRGGTMCGSIHYAGQQYGDPQNASLSYAALDSFGNDAIPYLMNKLTGKDSAIEKMPVNVIGK